MNLSKRLKLTYKVFKNECNQFYWFGFKGLNIKAAIQAIKTIFKARNMTEWNDLKKADLIITPYNYPDSLDDIWNVDIEDITQYRLKHNWFGPKAKRKNAKL